MGYSGIARLSYRTGRQSGQPRRFLGCGKEKHSSSRPCSSDGSLPGLALTPINSDAVSEPDRRRSSCPISTSSRPSRAWRSGVMVSSMMGRAISPSTVFTAATRARNFRSLVLSDRMMFTADLERHAGRWRRPQVRLDNVRGGRAQPSKARECWKSMVAAAVCMALSSGCHIVVTACGGAGRAGPARWEPGTRRRRGPL
jgi:hypothetical protein